uniref:F-box domain-containing protein n=1 Tax=Rhizophagus irregularis (strain DAOM 181602 / DAOM 197198 / MUCL 43194) TaxID=747089 RepID=U9TAI7_RHIID
MACSKIFSGDLPELTNEIIQHFRKDFSTLYSCILVNRLWCRLAVPLLWEDPFSKHDPKNCHFIEIYLSKSNEDDKAKFNEYGIKYDLLRSNNTLFNYPSFIKYLNYEGTYRSVKEWIDILVDDDDLNEVGELISIVMILWN